MGYSYFLLHNIQQEAEIDMLQHPSPTLSFVHEVIVAYLQELTFYLVELNKLGISNDTIKNNILEILSGIAINYDYSENQFMNILNNLYSNLQQAKELYSSVCLKNGIKATFIKQHVKDPAKSNYSNMIRLGEKIFHEKFSKYNQDELHLFEIILTLVKSINVHMWALNELGADIKEEFDFMLKEMGEFFNQISENPKEEILNFVRINKKLFCKLNEAHSKKYGQQQAGSVSTSTREGKAILVSGSNFFELEKLLESVEGKGIDVYTHGHLLLAHTYPNLKKYKSLVGHYGNSELGSAVDFASFPGPILLTRHSFNRVDNIFSAKIYTMDIVAPSGIAIIKDMNFEKIIQAALGSKGFTKYTEKPPIDISIGEQEFFEHARKTIEGVKSGKVKNIIFIGQKDFSDAQQNYFDNFLDLIGDDTHVYSMSYDKAGKHVIKLPPTFGHSAMFRGLEKVDEIVGLKNVNVAILATRCMLNTIPALIYARDMGIENVYLCECPQKFSNPATIKKMRELYEIKSYTSPKSDYEVITSINIS